MRPRSASRGRRQPGEGSAEAGSFTFEFFLHVADGHREAFRREIGTTGGRVEQLSNCRFRIGCPSQREIRAVGLWLFRTHFKDKGSVVEVTGMASLNASDYQYAQTRAERRSRGK